MNHFPIKALQIAFWVYVLAAGTAVQAEAPAPPSPQDRVTFSKEAGRIESGGAKVVLTSLVVESCCEAGQSMRSVRIDLLDAESAKTVYLQEQDIEPLRRAVESLDDEIARSEPAELEKGQALSCRGSGEALMVDYCTHADWVGLSIAAPGNDSRRFNFPGRSLREFGRILSEAFDALQAWNAMPFTP